jgi:hypothetical protein
MWSPDAVAVAWTRGPGQHALAERDSQLRAQRAQVRFRRAQEIAGVDHRRRLAAALGQFVEQASLLRQADITGRHRRARFHVGGHDLARIADQQHVGERMDPVVRHPRQQVVAHVLLVPERASPRHRPEQCRDDFRRVGLAGGDHFLARRVVQAGGGEVRGVQRLIAHRAVAAVLPGTHHRGGDVARAAPHRDAQRRRGGRAHARRFPARKARSRSTSPR